MVTSVATITAAVQYTPPNAQTNSGNSSFSAAVPYNAQNVGTIDVPIGQSIATVYSIPFGSVSGAKGFAVKNGMSSDVIVRINGLGSDEFKIAPAGFIVMAESSAPGSLPLSALTLTTTAAPSTIEQITYMVFGD
jgi:hypothetical protein